MPTTCAIDGCSSPHAARGWCKKHYYRWKKHGDPEFVLRRYSQTGRCEVDGCESPHKSHGLCKNHYYRYRRYGSPTAVAPPTKRAAPRGCSVDGCGRKHARRGLCEMHWRRLEKHGDVSRGRVSKRTQFACNVDGCDAQALARHMCQKHYARWQTHGDPLVDKRSKAAFRATLDWRNLDDLAKLMWGHIGSGYRGASWPEHPNANRTGVVAHHTAVVAATLGRPLTDGETVHHVNGIRDDNRPENLELWLSRHRPGQRVSELLAWAHELIERYKDDMQLWPEHLQP